MSMGKVIKPEYRNLGAELSGPLGLHSDVSDGKPDPAVDHDPFRWEGQTSQPRALAVGSVLGIAGQIFSFFGVNPADVAGGIAKLIAGKNGDKKQRLQRIEMLGIATSLQAAAVLSSIEGRNDETALSVRDGLILSLTQTIGTIVQVADLDNSSGG